MSAIDRQALRWIALQSENKLDENDRANLDAWLAEDTRHQGAFIRAAVIQNALRQAANQNAIYPGEDRYSLRSSEADSNRHSIRRNFLRYGALAAGVAILGLTTAVPYFSERTTLTTAKGEFRRVELADSSVASINSGSELKVKLGKHERQITLEKGEAWFEVAKNRAKPFVVEVGDVHARAVGTAFGVRRFSGGAEILVTDGLVEVWTDSGSATRKLLGPGERAFVTHKAAEILVARQPGEIERKLAWRQGKLIFARHTLSDAVADFNRYSRRKIVIADPALESKRIFGQYQIDAPEQFARDIGTYLNVPIVVTSEKIIIGAADPG
jgi:transmembrane sensor